MSFRTYFDVHDPDRSDLAGQVEAQRKRVGRRLAAVRRVVAVTSGKGGVGKSYVTALLAAGASGRLQQGVGVLDGDLRSPTVARMLRAEGPLRVNDEGVHPATGHSGVKVVSTDFLLEDGQPLAWHEPDDDQFLWRGALETGALREFLSDVVWGPLDLLLVDLPPGADGVADLRALVPDLAGAIAVTLPSPESRRSVERTVRSATTAKIPVLGIVENMSVYQCDGCEAPGRLFEGDAGMELAAEFGVPLLGQLPFRPGRLDESSFGAAEESLVGRFLEVLP